VKVGRKKDRKKEHKRVRKERQKEETKRARKEKKGECGNLRDSLESRCSINSRPRLMSWDIRLLLLQKDIIRKGEREEGKDGEERMARKEERRELKYGRDDGRDDI
jgi:hypothetical protein